jgi:poly(3-hydroxybutyrate) depolymerase
MRGSFRTARSLPLALCAALLASAPKPEAGEKAISAGGRVRTYRLYAPRGLRKDRPTETIWEFFRRHPRP